MLDTLRTSKIAALTAWRVYFALAILQTCLALALLFQTRSADSAGLALGISPVRLILILGLAALGVLFLGLFLESWIAPRRFERSWERLAFILSRRWLWNTILLVCSAVFLLGLLSIAQLTDVQEPFTRVFFDRLKPLVVWFVGLGAQTAIALLALRHGREIFSLRPQGRLFYFVLFVFLVIFWGWSWAARMVMPLESQRVGWNLMGVPVVEWQVLTAWLAGMLTLLVVTCLDRPSPPTTWLRRFALRRFDLILGLLIWLAAVVIWQGMPLAPSWFVTKPAPPNYEFYPNSDALAYDAMAQSALVGEGYRFYSLLYARRPLLAMYLTLLRLLGGQGYEQVVFLQILVLAWIPVLVYWLTKALHNRVSGVIAASLIIQREANSIWLTERITTSHVKLLMADLPAMLVTVLFVLLGVVWLQHLAERKLLALICGGTLGLAMLVRPEAFVFAIPLLLICALLLWKDGGWRLWLQSGVLFSLGLLLVISPWIWRNYATTGEIFFDSPLHNTSLIQQRFQVEPGAPDLPAEDAETPTTAESAPLPAPPRESTRPSTSPLSQTQPPAPTPETSNLRLRRQVNQLFGRVLQEPDVLARASLAHYLNSQVQSLLILPAVFRGTEGLIAWLGHRSAERLWEDCCGATSYIRRAPFWRQWDGRFPASTWVALSLNLLLIAYGINTAWKRKRWIGSLPLAFGLTYLLANALFRNSGGRYILPVDWATLVYFSIGLAQFTQAAVGYLRDVPVAKISSDEARPANEPRLPSPRLPLFYFASIGLFLLGCAVPFVEASFPRRYDEAVRDAMISVLLRSERLSETQRGDLYLFIVRGGNAFAGRALYPRFFPANAGDPGRSKKDPFAPRSYPRMVFYLAGSQNSTLSLPIEAEPERFPNAQDVLVVGCNPRDLLLVALFSPEGAIDAIYLRSDLPSRLRCPLPPVPGADN
jgi:hypothetical protein